MRKKKGPRDLSKKTMPQLTNTLDEVFSLFIRLKYAKNGVCKCYTCGKSIIIGDPNCQAGHFISRRHSATRWDERNVRPQCGRPCNQQGMGGGEPLKFEFKLKEEYGELAIENMKKIALMTNKKDRIWMIDRIEYYREEVKKLEHNRKAS